MGKARKRRTKLITELSEQHPDWDSWRMWHRANDIDQREQARLQGIRWRREWEARGGKES